MQFSLISIDLKLPHLLRPNLSSISQGSPFLLASPQPLLSLWNSQFYLHGFCRFLPKVSHLFAYICTALQEVNKRSLCTSPVPYSGCFVRPPILLRRRSHDWTLTVGVLSKSEIPWFHQPGSQYILIPWPSNLRHSFVRAHGIYILKSEQSAYGEQLCFLWSN